ncbi:MAG: hypothetical protein IPP41_12765, partial [Rhodocyclaceae bacterium]|nr:hypothetical protein [Rhodocyclaceae bacterium]
MTTWKNCTADILFYDDTAAITNDGGYVVRLSDQTIEVAYDDDDGAVCYRGKNEAMDASIVLLGKRSCVAALFSEQPFHGGYWQEERV